MKKRLKFKIDNNIPFTDKEWQTYFKGLGIDIRKLVKLLKKMKKGKKDEKRKKGH